MIRECGIYKAGQLLQQQLASECVVLPAKRGVAKHPNFAKQNMCESSRAQRHKQHSVTVARELLCYPVCKVLDKFQFCCRINVKFIHKPMTKKSTQRMFLPSELPVVQGQPGILCRMDLRGRDEIKVVPDGNSTR